MNETAANDSVQFQARFQQRQQAQRYRDRYKSGRHAKIDRMERAILRRILSRVGKLEVAMDLPCGTGRLSPLIAEQADRMIMADASDVMLEVAREDLPTLKAEYIVVDAENIALPDGSVDLIFCHRFLHHINEHDLRQRIFNELGRVTRRYVILSYYAAGFRSRWRWWLKYLLGKVPANTRPATQAQFYEEAARAGLRTMHQEILRKYPPGLFCLFEKKG